MKVLIIGAKGMLGQVLMRVFSRGGFEVVAWDREEIDISNFKAIRSKLSAIRFDLIINSAAYNDVDGAEAAPELANAVNGYAVGELAQICRESDVPLVHYSTDYVFEGSNQEGYREDDLPNPISKYGESKYLGEQELRKNVDKYYLIRLSRLFGLTSFPSSPLLPRGGKKSFVELMLELAKTKTEIEVIDDEVSCPTYAPDLTERTKYIVEQKLPFGIYHAPNGGEAVTWYGFAKEIFAQAKINVKLIPAPSSRFPRAAKRPQYSALLNTKLPPMRPWPEALKEFLISNF